MRKRFEPQLELGQLLIEDTPRSRDGMADLVVALRELYKNKEYRDRHVRFFPFFQITMTFLPEKQKERCSYFAYINIVAEMMGFSDRH